MATIICFHPHISCILRNQPTKSQFLHSTTSQCLNLTPHQRSFTKIPSKFSTQYRLLLTKASHSSDISQSQPEPPKPPSSAWKKWMVGLVLSILLPSFRNKWGPFQALKSKVDAAIETAECVTEVAEELAEEAEKAAEQVEEMFPDDARLKKAMESVENLAEEAVKKSKVAEDIIHKVEEAEKVFEEALVTGSHVRHVNGKRPKKKP